VIKKIIKRILAQFVIQMYYYKKSIILIMVSLSNIYYKFLTRYCNYFAE